MKQVSKLIKLTKAKRRILIQAYLLLISIRLGLWLLPFQKIMQITTRLSQAPLQSFTSQPQKLEQIIWAINASSRYMPGNVKCLARALAGQILLSRNGYAPQLRIGVAKGDRGQLEAHAWVEANGKVVIGNLQDLPRFTTLPSLQTEVL